MHRVTLHVPETRNDGSPVATAELEAHEAELLQIAGGFTLIPAIGAWRSSTGEVYREPLRLYAVDVADERTVRAQMLELAECMSAELGQEVIYLTVSEVVATGVTAHVSRATDSQLEGALNVGIGTPTG